MGFELALVFYTRDLSCEVDVREEILDDVEDLLLVLELHSHKRLQLQVTDLEVTRIKALVDVPAQGAIVFATVEDCVQVTETEEEVLVQVAVVKGASETAVAFHLTDVPLELHFDTCRLLKCNFD